jgi:hypothetical protein
MMAVSIAKDKRLVFYGLVLLILHALGIVVLYDVIPEFDNVPHFWFGYVLSAYSSKASSAVNLQSRLCLGIQKRWWTTFSIRQADLLLRLGGFLLVGGLFWEWAELAFSGYLGIRPDSFLAFPITLHNIDGTLDVSVGTLGAVAAFLVAAGKRE